MPHAILVHGLNNPPELMKPIQQRLDQLGISSTIGRLTGHYEEGGRLERFKQVTPEIWKADVERLTQEHPADFFVGFSLGALLGALVAQEGRGQFKKMIFFAPAFYLRPWSYLPRALGFTNITFRSAMPKNTRANVGTPVKAYLALFELVRQFEAAKLTTPHLIIANPLDELVDYQRTREHFPDTLSITRTPKVKHLIVSEKYVGPENWEKIWREIRKFIG